MVLYKINGNLSTLHTLFGCLNVASKPTIGNISEAEPVALSVALFECLSVALFVDLKAAKRPTVGESKGLAL